MVLSQYGEYFHHLRNSDSPFTYGVIASLIAIYYRPGTTWTEFILGIIFLNYFKRRLVGIGIIGVKQ